MEVIVHHSTSSRFLSVLFGHFHIIYENDDFFYESLKTPHSSAVELLHRHDFELLMIKKGWITI